MTFTFSSALTRNLINKQNWLSFFAGLSLVFAYAPYSLWWITIPALLLWFTSLHNKSEKQAAKQGFIFGFGWFACGISWVHVSIDQFGGLPLIVSLGLMLLLCFYLALFPALACYLCGKLSHHATKNNVKNNKNISFNLWFLPGIWVFTEWLRSWVLTGFPWLSFGYSQIDSPLAYFAPVIGEVGITFVLISLAVACYYIINNKNRALNTTAVFMIVSLTILFSQLTWLENSNDIKRVAAVQGNIEQSIKWAPEQEWPTMHTYLNLTKQVYDADVIVWPESAIPTVEPLAGEYLDLTDKSAALNNTAIITGIIDYHIDTKSYFNSLVVLGKKHADSKTGDYYYSSSNQFNKHHLLPIGEFVPFQEWLRPLAPFFNLPMSSFSRGAFVQPNLEANGIKLAPLICFEIAFPEQLAANFHDDTNFILTVSNDAWFGNSHGPHQHLDIARMRALEFGRPVIRSTNNGITAVIDHNGKVTARIPQFIEAVLKTDVQMVIGRTPFSIYQRYITFILALLLLGLVFLINRKST